MSRSLTLHSLLVLAALLIGVGTAGVAVAVDSPAPTLDDRPDNVVSLPNTTNYVSPAFDETARRGYVRSNVDVAAAVAADAERLDGRHDVLSFGTQYESSNSSEARLAFVRETITTTEQRLATLDARQNTLFRSYSNGSVSQESFIRRLARLEASAAETRQLLQRIDSRVRADIDTSLPVSTQTRLAALRAELVTLPAPITSRVAGSLQGEASPSVVYAEGAGNAVVLATVDETEFIRQATLRTQYRPDAPNQFEQSDDEPISVAFDRARTLYPWVSNNLQSINRIAGFGDSDVYLIDLSHPHGTLTSYIHGGSANVFHEVHRQRPDDVPVQLTARSETATLALQVNATAETGPMRVSVRRTTTNTLTDAVVRINGEVVGSTGSDGRLWTIRPSGALRVNATTSDGTSVVVTRP